jgi:hypothetical protein
VYRYFAWVVFAAIVVQVAFAGYGAFFVAKEVEDATVDEDKFMDGFGIHAGFGYLVLLLTLLFLIIAAVNNVGRWRVGLAGLLFPLTILQVLLAWFGFEVPAIGALHPVNALVLFALSWMVAWTAWREGDRVGVHRTATPT